MAKGKITIRGALSWVGAAQIAKVVLQLVSLIVLARLLSPSDYGLMAMASVVTVFATLFREFGTGAAIIHAEKIEETLKNTIFWFNVVTGLSLTILIGLIAKPISIFYGEPKIFLILMYLAPSFIISSLSIVPQALLERDSNFKPVVFIEISSALIALVLAIWSAAIGFGVYALVVNTLAASILVSTLYWLIGDWYPKFEFKIKVLQEIWKYSGNIFIFNTVNYLQRNTDSLLIGRFIGTLELGYYNLAYRILLLPLNLITSSVNRVMFPIYSRFQTDRLEVGNHYIATLVNIALITAPLMGLIWTIREPLISLFLGDKWLPVANIVAWLAPVGFFQSIVSTSGSVLNAVGRSDILRNLGFIGVPFLVAGIIIGIPWGVEGVAAGYCIANALWVYPVISTVLRQLDFNFIEFLTKTYIPTLVAIALSILGYYLLLPALGDRANWFVLLIVVFSYGIVYLVFVFLWMPDKTKFLYDTAFKTALCVRIVVIPKI